MKISQEHGLLLTAALSALREGFHHIAIFDEDVLEMLATLTNQKCECEECKRDGGPSAEVYKSTTAMFLAAAEFERAAKRYLEAREKITIIR